MQAVFAEVLLNWWWLWWWWWWWWHYYVMQHESESSSPTNIEWPYSRFLPRASPHWRGEFPTDIVGSGNPLYETLALGVLMWPTSMLTLIIIIPSAHQHTSITYHRSGQSHILSTRCPTITNYSLSRHYR